jgi:hypothetical protein
MLFFSNQLSLFLNDARDAHLAVINPQFARDQTDYWFDWRITRLRSRLLDVCWSQGRSQPNGGQCECLLLYFVYFIDCEAFDIYFLGDCGVCKLSC